MKIIQTIRVTVDSEEQQFEVDEKLFAEEKRTDFKKTKQELVDLITEEGATSVELLDFQVIE